MLLLFPMYEALGDTLRAMDPAHRAFLAIGIAVMLKVMLANWWERFKAREALKPVTMKMQNGVHVPYGIVQRVQRLVQIAMWIWIVYMVVLLGLLAYMKFMGIKQFF